MCGQAETDGLNPLVLEKIREVTPIACVSWEWYNTVEIKGGLEEEKHGVRFELMGLKNPSLVTESKVVQNKVLFKNRCPLPDKQGESWQGLEAWIA